MRRRFRTVVIGGGILGVASAVALQRRRLVHFIFPPTNRSADRSWSKFGHYSEEHFSRLRDDLC